MASTPGYLSLFGSGELARRAEQAVARLSECRMCPRDCAVDRLRGELGVCRTGRHAQVASWNLHFGEEAPLVGKTGSGTIFFAQCNLNCVFCQNWDISHPGEAFPETDAGRLAQIMLELQAEGAANINFVSPSHVTAQILEALPIAVERGLAVPLVYNSGGYDSLETLRLLDGVVDIYMPDAKFWDPQVAKRLCGAKDYPQRAREAITEMHRQVGDLRLDGTGMARKGLLVRHLVMPEGLAGTAEWMRFIAGLSKDTYVNVMEQYRPCGKACAMPGIDRAVSAQECREAKQMALDAGLTRLDDRCGNAAYKLLERLMNIQDE